jgi:hypothetical protein
MTHEGSKIACHSNFTRPANRYAALMEPKAWLLARIPVEMISQAWMLPWIAWPAHVSTANAAIVLVDSGGPSAMPDIELPLPVGQNRQARLSHGFGQRTDVASDVCRRRQINGYFPGTLRTCATNARRFASVRRTTASVSMVAV